MFLGWFVCLQKRIKVAVGHCESAMAAKNYFLVPSFIRGLLLRWRGHQNKRFGVLCLSCKSSERHPTCVGGIPHAGHPTCMRLSHMRCSWIQSDAVVVVAVETVVKIGLKHLLQSSYHRVLFKSHCSPFIIDHSDHDIICILVKYPYNIPCIIYQCIIYRVV